MARRLGIVLLCVLALVLAACGGEKQSDAAIWDQSNWDQATWQ